MMVRAATLPFEQRNKRDEIQWQQRANARTRTQAEHVSNSTAQHTSQWHSARCISLVQCLCALPFSRQIRNTSTSAHMYDLFCLLSVSLHFSLAHTFVPRFLIEI